jgi:hypothetical protein
LPCPFMLAHALDAAPNSLGHPGDRLIEMGRNPRTDCAPAGKTALCLR